MDPITITSGGVQLTADFYPASGDLAFVVTHGWGSERPVDIPAALAGAGFPTLAHDLRGHGESGGVLEQASRADWVADLVAVIDRLHALAPSARIGLLGASFGAYLSLMASDTRAVAALSLRVPANLPDDDFDSPYLDRFGPGNRRREDIYPADSRALRALRGFGGSVQLIDADGDGVIPAQTIEDYAAAVEPSRLSRYTLHGPHHLATPELRGEYIAALLAWADSV
ncbi:alpha/beta fold hydrolase [Sporichthya sp.]|uniref:alpha/beta hydrolase family protein n=1 Tax=Sporichthya sp. TaxID=65475 RepID=UPI0017A0B1F3|nr:alpha/beta fold hydrolase [Sporichthya sp.]MBA3744286.1 alpha/beta fold hydrolase [Sporichthya sp.]